MGAVAVEGPEARGDCSESDGNTGVLEGMGEDLQFVDGAEDCERDEGEDEYPEAELDI